MNHKLRVLLVQLPVPNNPSLNTPLAAGYLKAYAYAQGLAEIAEIAMLPRHLADHAGDALLVAEIVARQPQVLGVSLYTWNSERSLDITRRVKARLPELKVIVGGPEVQKDNLWLLQHPAVDVAVLGEGEQTFCDLLLQIADCRLQIERGNLQSIPGIAFRDTHGELVFTPDRVSLGDLSVIPSPYLAGYLEVPADGMLMVEVSRWCPYSCSFCLYGRNMGSKLGSRYFGLERVLAEIRWGREQGIKRIHFVEANLNLVPLFWPLMRALEDLNCDQQMTFYAELRGEHLTEEVVIALDRANVRYVEVGLQTANLTALKASLRRTDLQKWAAGTRRLYAHGIEVYLDVILGLPADDQAGIAETLDFIQREELGAHDVFTLQVLPGTAVRQQADQYGMRFQQRPPYYVLATDRLDYGELRRLRRDLKLGAGLDPDEIEGCPPPRLQIADCRLQIGDETAQSAICNLQLVAADDAAWLAAESHVSQLAAHVDLFVNWDDEQPSSNIDRLSALLAHALAENPSTLFDCYLMTATPPQPDALRAWRAALPYQPGYLDRVAVYQRDMPQPQHERVSPRLWLVLPWTSQADPASYAGVAELIWAYEIAADEEPPLSAWAAAGGAGVWVRGASPATVAAWRQSSPLRLWSED